MPAEADTTHHRTERTILSFRPSVASIVLRPLQPILIFILGFGILWWFAPPSGNRDVGLALLLALLIARVVWQAIWRACVTYELTDRRVRSMSGVFSRFGVEIPLGRVQNTFLSQSFPERLASVGTLGIASAGTDMIEISWEMIDAPHDVLAKVRQAVDRAGAGEGLGPDQPVPVKDLPTMRAGSGPSGPPSDPLIILGLVGGIGSGKSTVAAKLGSHYGALVLDSDTQAKQMLDRPEVRDTLVSWWGAGILQHGGRIDRRKIADIVFADPTQRSRLEGLVHPLLKDARQKDLREAAAAGRRFAIIDAPLLLEAGVDKECDAVVFVDSPREQRLDRIRGRSWDDAELDRRERAQLPLAEKRVRSQFILTNDADEATLDKRIAALVKEVSDRFR